MVSSMRSWLGWENPRMTCTLQLPGRDSEKRPEGFDKAQFYSAAGVAVQRLGLAARARVAYLLTRPDSIRANPVPAESRVPLESAADRSRASLEHRFSAACDNAPAHGSRMLPRRRLRGAIT